MEPISLNIFLTRTMHKLLVFLLLFRVETLWAADPADLADSIVISELEKILEGEDHLLRDLQLYVAALEHKVHTIRQFVRDADERWQRAQPDLDAFLGNILNGFPLMRRMRMDAPKLLSYMRRDAGEEDLQHIEDYNLDIVQDEDMQQAAKAALDTEQQFDDTVRLSSLDYLSLAHYLRQQDDLEQASVWLRLALEQYDQLPEEMHQLMQLDRASILGELSEMQLQRG